MVTVTVKLSSEVLSHPHFKTSKFQIKIQTNRKASEASPTCLLPGQLQQTHTLQICIPNLNLDNRRAPAVGVQGGEPPFSEAPCKATSFHHHGPPAPHGARPPLLSSGDAQLCHAKDWRGKQRGEPTACQSAGSLQ